MKPEYAHFDALTAAHVEGQDFRRISKRRAGAKVVIIAPHGGKIEPHTTAIAREIAGEDFSLYYFQSNVPKKEANLHITSHRFDDPKCVALVKEHRWVVAIHGCNEKGARVLLGGSDETLVGKLATRLLKKAGIHGETTGHKFPGRHQLNICNRGATGKGVQFELSMAFRRGVQRQAFVRVVRAVLLELQHEG